MKTTPQKRWGRESERKKKKLPVAFLTKQAQGTEVQSGVGFVSSLLGWFVSFSFGLGFFSQCKRFYRVPEFCKVEGGEARWCD